MRPGWRLGYLQGPQMNMLGLVSHRLALGLYSESIGGPRWVVLSLQKSCEWPPYYLLPAVLGCVWGLLLSPAHSVLISQEPAISG